MIKQVKANTGYFPNKTVAELYKQIFQPTGAWEAKATMWERIGATKGYQKLITVDADTVQNPNYKTITDHTYYRQRITLHSYLILSYIRGDDIGNVYCKLNDSEKKQIAKEVVKIQRKVSRLDIHADMEWTWNCFVDKMLNRAEKRIKRKNYFDFNKIYIIKKLQQEIQEYLDKVPIAPYLDDISTRNLLIYEGNVSGIIDIDWMGFGDMLTFVALTRVSLLNMDLDTKYIDYLLDEIRPNTIEYKAFIFYCLIYCVDFMGEIGMQFLDKTIPVNENIIERLNDIFDFLMEEWDKYCKR